jgi:hypothetical protein
MCSHCGCGQPENQHGDSRNLTVSQLRSAMKTSAHQKGTGNSPQATGREISRMLSTRKRK